MAGDQPIIDDINRNAEQPSLSGRVAAMSDGAQQMLASAHGGQLVFDPQTGQSLLNTLNSVIDQLTGHQSDTFRIRLVSKLGLTAGGRAIADFNGQVAATGPSAFKPAHDQFLRNLVVAAEAVKIAIGNYARTEQHITRSFQPGH